MGDRPSFRATPRLLTARGSSDWFTMYWHYMPKWITDRAIASGVDLNPLFQRPRVWTPEQKTKYLEFRLMGGQTGRDIHFNTASPNRGWTEPLLLMDGKQRVDAVLEFLADKVPVFGHVLSEYEDRPDYSMAEFHFHVHNFEDPDDILQWYCDMNRGGVIHSDAEIQLVQALKGKHASLESTPAERLDELLRYPVLGLDEDLQWMLGKHLCGLPGMRPLSKEDKQHHWAIWRWEKCGPCEVIYRARNPPKPEPPPIPRAVGRKKGKSLRKRR